MAKSVRTAKLPPKQRTRKYESDSALDNDENLIDFLARCSALTPDESGFQGEYLKRPSSYCVRLTLNKSAGVLSVKTSPALLRFTGGNEELLLVFLVTQGALVLTQHDKTERLEKGAVWVTDATQAFTLVAQKECAFVFTRVHKSYFFAHAGFHAMHFLGHVFRGATALQRSFTAVYNQFDRLLEFVDARDAADMCDGLFCFLRPMLSEYLREHADTVGSADALRAKALDAMQRCLGDHTTTVERIAAFCGVSPRYLSRLFRESGTTVMRRLMKMRLDRAAVNLREKHLANTDIETVARDNGFVSASHFTRVFRTQFGMTPGAWRKKRS